MLKLLKIAAVVAIAAAASACIVIDVERGPDKPKPATTSAQAL